ncbi:MAG: sigma-54-dependent Fis family transcriptional regulator [Desulfobacteraceae bacterium 4572_123]|nr:MAG: sigma-54-dependent Fis family transcriptional regulator [Desulfobacteraceae bacterium 4572_123]
MFEKEVNTYWKTVVDTIQDGVMIVDKAGTIITINNAFETITGYTRKELLGKSCSILNCNTCRRVRKTNGNDYCALFANGCLEKQRCMVMRKHGSYVQVVKNASILKDSNGNLTGAVETITDLTDLIEKEVQIETFRRELKAEDRFHGIIGASISMQRLFDIIANAAKSDAPVIIHGESGTGKELVAKAIHNCSPRHQKPYIKVNCAALNESLLESELFGHVKGAFTGAIKSRQGRFEAALDGDIFLDEIGDMPLSTQVKLLRVIEEKVIERVGDHRPVPIHTRIISATNKDLWQLVKKEAFREDFYYRINVIPIWIPPLRERIGDIPLMAESFFRRIQLKSGKPIQGISNEALETLMQYSWPGNARELKSAFEYAFVSCREKMIAPHHFPAKIFQHNDNRYQPADESVIGLDEIKKRRLIDALHRSNGNQSKAAQVLGISRTSVWKQRKRYNI